MPQIRVAVIPDAGGHRIRIRIGKREYQSETVYTKVKDAMSAAREIARVLNASME